MRLAAAIATLLLVPFAALAQAPVDGSAAPSATATTATAAADGAWALPEWYRAGQPRWMLTADHGNGLTTSSGHGMPLPGALSPASDFSSAGFRWAPSSHSYTRFGVNRMTLDSAPTVACVLSRAACSPASDSWRGAEVGGGYHFPGFTLDVGASWLDHAGDRASLPTVLPNPDGALTGVLGVPGQWVDSLGGLEASGSLRIGDDAHVKLGASVGRMQMLPGSGSGFDAIDQRALSFGVGTDAISGTIIGRVMQPIGSSTALPGANQRWSAVDLGVTLHFPWQGDLSVGAQNLWSSGHAPQPAAPTEPAQSRVPYIQYHQEL